MPATNGSGLSFRSSRGVILCCVAAVLLVSALYTSTASAAKKTSAKPKHFYYLALGDSISYGYSLVKFTENHGRCKEQGPAGPACEPPTAFEPNFVTYYGSHVPKKNKTSTVNLSCPGETSSGLIGHNVALGGGAGSAFNPCGWHNGLGFRRHAEYGSVSQLEAAIGMMKEKPGAVSQVTLQIGSNDELAVLGACQNAAYRTAHSFTSAEECAAAEAPALFKKILTNMGDTIGVLRAAGGYSGPVVILGFYNPYGVLQPGTDTLQAALNSALEENVNKGKFGPRVRVANPFSLFNPATGEKKALEKYTEFYNIFAIEYSRIKITEEHEAAELPALIAFEEASGSPNLAEATAFTEAFGQPPVLPNLAETTSAQEKFGKPSLAEVTAFQEAAGTPTLAQATAFQEASGTPNLAEATAFQEASGTPNLAETTAFQEASGTPNLAETTAGAEPGAHAAFIAKCEGESFTTVECEEQWTSAGKAAFEAAVKKGFDEEVKKGFDAAVKKGFDAAVKSGFDAAVKAGYDAAVKKAYDETVRAGFDAEVKRIFAEKWSKGSKQLARRVTSTRRGWATKNSAK